MLTSTHALSDSAQTVAAQSPRSAAAMWLALAGRRPGQHRAVALKKR
ncbi:hypothetical protein PQQ75_18760 [Paraburkholderia aspalathi]